MRATTVFLALGTLVLVGRQQDRPPRRIQQCARFDVVTKIDMLPLGMPLGGNMYLRSESVCAEYERVCAPAGPKYTGPAKGCS